MNVEFIAYQPDKYKIVLYDCTPVYQDNIPEQIYALSLDIANLDIPNGRIAAPIDILAYLFSSDRTDNNLYVITSEYLGLGEDQEIPDGVYDFTYVVNNNYTKEHKFLVYKTVEERTLKIIEETNYNMQVGSYDIEYVGDTCEGDIEQVRLAVNLLDELRASSSNVGDEETVLSSLDKLQRLLTLIENEII